MASIQDKSQPTVTIQDEKLSPIESVREDVESNTSINDAVWRPGFVAQFPLLGALALLTALLCAVFGNVVLAVSDDRSDAHYPWKKLPPNVILSGLNSVANLALTVAVGQGIAIAWWRRTLKGASIQDLHRSWSFSTSALELLFSARYFNVIALTALVTKLSIVDNMLLQRATSTYSSYEAPEFVHNVTFPVAMTFPVTGTRLLSAGNDGSASALSDVMATTLQVWQAQGGTYNTNEDSLPDLTGCPGMCDIYVPAIGLAMDCAAPVNVGLDVAARLSSNTSTALPLFDISFKMQQEPFGANGSLSAFIRMDLLWTNTKGEGDVTANGRADPAENVSTTCPGVFTTRSCNLYPAIVNYTTSVTTYGPKDTSRYGSDISLGYNYTNNYSIYDASVQQINDHRVVKRLFVPPTSGSFTQLGGIKDAFEMYLAGTSTLRNASYAQGYDLEQNGTAPMWLLTHPQNYQCGYNFTPPIYTEEYYNDLYNNFDSDKPSQRGPQADVLSNINQIMFALALRVSDPWLNAYTDPQTGNWSYPVGEVFVGSLSRAAVFYDTNNGYRWGGFASMVVCILLVIPSYWGYWQLGRKVTLGPVEIAHAFRSPMTAPPADDPAALAKTNGTIKEIIQEVGDRQVRFGQIVDGDAKGILGVAEPEHVARVHPKIGSARSEFEHLFRATSHKF